MLLEQACRAPLPPVWPCQAIPARRSSYAPGATRQRLPGRRSRRVDRGHRIVSSRLDPLCRVGPDGGRKLIAAVARGPVRYSGLVDGRSGVARQPRGHGARAAERPPGSGGARGQPRGGRGRPGLAADDRRAGAPDGGRPGAVARLLPRADRARRPRPCAGPGPARRRRRRAGRAGRGARSSPRRGTRRVCITSRCSSPPVSVSPAGSLMPRATASHSSGSPTTS